MFFETPAVDLASDKVEQHAQVVSDAFAPHPSLFTYLPFGPFPSLSSLLRWHREYFVNNQSRSLYLIYALTPDDDKTFAGTIGYLEALPAAASIEMGYITVLPQFQRTSIAKHAIALLLRQALDLESEGGWGLRRVQWKAHGDNVASIKVAEKMGFKMEGILRWERMLPSGKIGTVTEQDRLMLRRGQGSPGRHTAVLAVCWDDWETGTRDVVNEMLDQRSRQ